MLVLGLAVGLAVGLVAGRLMGRHAMALTELQQARIELATGGAAHQTYQREQALDDLVQPLQHALHQVQRQLQDSERQRLTASAMLDEHLAAMALSAEGLRLETSQLVSALRAPEVRGRWGELQLERVVEAAGLVEHVDYVTQPTVTTADGTLRPDLVVRLVGGKHVVIDSKVAFVGYLEALQATDEKVRQARLRAHSRHLRAHIEALGSKQYWARFAPSPEFVVCFVPADAFLDAALREDPGLLELGFDRNVVIATPSTLIALLRTIGYTWRQEALARNTAEITQLGRDLHHRLLSMTAHFDKMGRSLTAAVGSFNSTVGAFESRVLVSARKLGDLSVVDAAADSELSPVQPILLATRSPASESAAG